MPTDLVVNNNTYPYPIPGDEPGWGEGATGWAVEVTDVLQGLQGTNDIPDTSFTIANNTVVAADIVGLLFNPAQVRSAIIEYSIYRTGTGPTTELSEIGTLELIYKNGGPINSKWSIGRFFYGDDAGILFTMTDAGQMKYTSSVIAGTYTGAMRFSARVTLQ